MNAFPIGTVAGAVGGVVLVVVLVVSLLVSGRYRSNSRRSASRAASIRQSSAIATVPLDIVWGENMRFNPLSDAGKREARIVQTLGDGDPLPIAPLHGKRRGKLKRGQHVDVSALAALPPHMRQQPKGQRASNEGLQRRLPVGQRPRPVQSSSPSSSNDASAMQVRLPSNVGPLCGMGRLIVGGHEFSLFVSYAGPAVGDFPTSVLESGTNPAYPALVDTCPTRPYAAGKKLDKSRLKRSAARDFRGRRSAGTVLQSPRSNPLLQAPIRGSPLMQLLDANPSLVDNHEPEPPIHTVRGHGAEVAKSKTSASPYAATLLHPSVPPAAAPSSSFVDGKAQSPRVKSTKYSDAPSSSRNPLHGRFTGKLAAAALPPAAMPSLASEFYMGRKLLLEKSRSRLKSSADRVAMPAISTSMQGTVVGPSFTRRPGEEDESPAKDSVIIL